MKNQQLIQMAAMVKTKYPLLLMQGVRVNDLIVAEYQEATGQKVFKTFNEWLEVGQVVKKGEKGFPVFSKPSKKLKEEAGEESTEGRNYFYTAYLFHAGQVEPVKEKTTNK